MVKEVGDQSQARSSYHASVCQVLRPTYLIAQLVELRVGSSNPALGTRTNGPPVCPAENGYVALGHGWHHGCLTSGYNGSNVIHPMIGDGAGMYRS